jgi:hypothetical protein
MDGHDWERGKARKNPCKNPTWYKKPGLSWEGGSAVYDFTLRSQPPSRAKREAKEELKSGKGVTHWTVSMSFMVDRASQIRYIRLILAYMSQEKESRIKNQESRNA